MTTNDDALMSAAPRPITFADGTSFRMSPLTDADISELDNWLRQRYVRTVMDSLPKDATDATEERTRMAAAREAMNLTWMSGLGANIMGTVDGMAQLCWQGCHHNHPDLTPEQLRKYMFNPTNIKEVAFGFKALNNANPQTPGRKKKGAKVRPGESTPSPRSIASSP